MLNVQFDFLQKSPTISQEGGSILQKLGHSPLKIKFMQFIIIIFFFQIIEIRITA